MANKMTIGELIKRATAANARLGTGRHASCLREAREEIARLIDALSGFCDADARSPAIV